MPGQRDDQPGISSSPSGSTPNTQSRPANTTAAAAAGPTLYTSSTFQGSLGSLFAVPRSNFAISFGSPSASLRPSLSCYASLSPSSSSSSSSSSTSSSSSSSLSSSSSSSGRVNGGATLGFGNIRKHGYMMSLALPSNGNVGMSFTAERTLPFGVKVNFSGGAGLPGDSRQHQRPKLTEKDMTIDPILPSPESSPEPPCSPSSSPAPGRPSKDPPFTRPPPPPPPAPLMFGNVEIKTARLSARYRYKDIGLSANLDTLRGPTLNLELAAAHNGLFASVNGSVNIGERIGKVRGVAIGHRTDEYTAAVTVSGQEMNLVSMGFKRKLSSQIDLGARMLYDRNTNKNVLATGMRYSLGKGSAQQKSTDDGEAHEKVNQNSTSTKSAAQLGDNAAARISIDSNGVMCIDYNFSLRQGVNASVGMTTSIRRVWHLAPKMSISFNYSDSASASKKNFVSK